MRLPVSASFVVSVVACAFASAAPVAAQVTASIPAVASVQARTSLAVSSHLLEFHIVAPGEGAAASVEFSAGARTASGAQVVLSIEPLTAVQGPGGAADVEASVAFEGQGAGTEAGVLTDQVPAVVARWRGSGLRTGRLLFTLRASAPGVYLLPLRFVISAP